MTLRRIVAVASLCALLLLVATPALAKGDFEFVISGGGLKHSVVVDSGDIYAAVRGAVWSPQENVPRLSGLRYEMDLYDIADGRRLLSTRWLYYPAQGGALITDSSGGTGEQPLRWEVFSPQFQRVLNDAITAKPVNAALVLTMAGLILVGAFYFVRKELRKVAAIPEPTFS